MSRRRSNRRRRVGKVTVRHADGRIEVRTPGSFRKPKRRQRTPYAEYLRSRHWRELRKLVLARDKYRCTECGDHESQLHVHHLTYERLGKEKLKDLVTLCRSCHLGLHQGFDLNHAHEPRSGSQSANRNQADTPRSRPMRRQEREQIDAFVDKTLERLDI